jgi:hypothetical protein
MLVVELHSADWSSIVRVTVSLWGQRPQSLKFFLHSWITIHCPTYFMQSGGYLFFYSHNVLHFIVWKACYTHKTVVVTRVSHSRFSPREYSCFSSGKFIHTHTLFLYKSVFSRWEFAWLCLSIHWMSTPVIYLVPLKPFFSELAAGLLYVTSMWGSQEGTAGKGEANGVRDSNTQMNRNENERL